MSTRLDGCRARPLGGYLQGLGLWRVLERCGVTDVTARWLDDRLVLDGAGDVDQIVDHLLERFSPLPIVSPWNAGSGLADRGKRATAENLMADVLQRDDARLAELQRAIRIGRSVVAEGRSRGWDSPDPKSCGRNAERSPSWS